jgi:hypothetical protein
MGKLLKQQNKDALCRKWEHAVHKKVKRWQKGRRLPPMQSRSPVCLPQEETVGDALY